MKDIEQAINLEQAIREAESEKDKAWRKYEIAKNAVNKLHIKTYEEKWLGKFIQIQEGESGPSEFMFVYNIWHSGTDATLIIEGIGFTAEFSEYLDDTYFSWSQFIQKSLSYQLLDDGYYKINVMDKETFDSIFSKIVDKMVSEHRSFEYKVRNSDDD
jgi:hypothetical protein